jgi:predicted dehydrogenase
MKPYSVGVVGLTDIATAPGPPSPGFFNNAHPHSHVACYANHPKTEVAAICDLVPELFDQFDKRWGSRWPNVQRYTDYREMLATENLDLLSVTTPDQLHAEVVLAAIPAGVRGIYCEKPIATTLADADQMIHLANEYGVSMIVNHTRRWYATYQYARSLIHTGALGRVTHMHAYCGGPRAMLFRNGTHLIDAISFFAESSPSWVVGRLDEGQQDYGPVYRGEGGKDPRLDPGGSAMIHYENGINASVFCSKTMFRDTFAWEVCVYCEHGSLQLSEPGGLRLETFASDELGGRTSRHLEVPQYAWTDGTAAIAELIDLVEGEINESQSSPQHARSTLAVLLAILQSQSQGNMPIRAPFSDAS